ncbi:hypothetical protein D7231_31830 [Streptomyces klenkii]|uniref:Uncharacterized protein n=1 Tax=Streptomyces klenkii TaxID=1420899 RepID=A0A3B0ANB9_9ACTN|nr:hypothetical protein [Streptomyces klenkii]RKN61864.1 hypothetical protein D7231_31830 [Streptomyces klenkii]
MGVLSKAASGRENLGVQGMPTPARQGYQTWTTAPDTCSTTLTLAAGRLYLSRLPVDEPFAATALDYYVSVAATSPTSGQCFVALFDADGEVVASKDAVADFGSTGVQTLTLAGTLTRQHYRFGILFNGSTGPQIPRSAGAAGGPAFANINLSAGDYRASYVEPHTSLPNPVSYGTGTAYIPLFAAVR